MYNTYKYLFLSALLDIDVEAVIGIAFQGPLH